VEPTPQAQETKETEIELPGLRVNRAGRYVDVDATVCLDDGLLELIACTPGSREHESVITVAARPIHIHTALLLIGANSGNPPLARPLDDEQTRWEFLPARGDLIEVFLAWKNPDGSAVERSISDFITSREEATETARPIQQKPRFPGVFIFAGSQLGDPGRKPREYLADKSGNVISISTFGDEVLCLPEHHSQSNRELQWQIDPTHLPKLQSKVSLRLRLKSSKP
jgi:hypothetical protein